MIIAVLRRVLNLLYRLRLGRKMSLDVRRAKVIALWRVRGAKGRLAVGRQSICHADISFDRDGASITIGARSYVGRSHLVAASSIEIGDDVLISWDVTITDHDSHSIYFADRAADVADWGEGKKVWTHVESAPVRVGDKSWLGFGSTILKGVSIGEGAIVAAKSVVTRDVAPWTLVGGAPAKLIRELSPNVTR